MTLPGVRPRSYRVLEPQERISEVLFGLIMVVTFTGSLSVATAGREDVRTMITGALGCNVAWGIIDGVFYLMGCLADRAQGITTLRALHAAKDAEEGRKAVSRALPRAVASALGARELEMIRERLLAEPVPGVPRLTARDTLGALGVFLLVFLATFPVTIPFLLTRDVAVAKPVSSAIALSMLLVAGVAYGRAVGRSAVAFGLGMVLLGGALVGLTIALGG